MKKLILIALILILFSGNALADWNVTWTPITESIIDKEYIITVQNMQTIKRDVNISSFFAETNFDISGVSDIKFYEWKDIPYTYTVDHYHEVECSEYYPDNDTWTYWTESVFNYTETIKSVKLDWKSCKSQLFKETGTTKEDNYGFINIPAYGSKPKDDGTYNGTKIFKLIFRTPVVYDGTYGSSGKVALLLDGEEHHPYWNTSWSNRQEIILTGNTSGAQTNYQILLNISYETGMQADFDDLRFTNDTHEIDSWLESKVDSSYALIWVEFPTTPANGINQTYYKYYGNVGASSNWDIEATFLLGDEFDGASINTSKWTVTGSVSVSDSEVSLNQDDAIKSIATFGFATITSAKSKADEQDTSFVGYYTDTNNRLEIVNSDAVAVNDFDNIMLVTYKASLHDAAQENQWSDFRNTYYQYTIKRINTSYIEYRQGSDSNTYTTSAYIPTGDMSVRMNVWDSSQVSTLISDWIFVRKYVANPPTYALGDIQYYVDSIYYNATNPYNHTIDSTGAIAVNHTITTADDINWTASALTDDCHLMVTEYNYTNTTLANFSVYTNTLDWLQITNLTPTYSYRLQYANGTGINTTTSAANGTINYTEDFTPDDYHLVVGNTSITITLYSSSPCCIFTNYTGIITGSYIVESNYPLNYSSLAFLMGVNYTPTSDMHAYLKPPATDIADGIYRAHNRNNTPYLSWEYNDTITEGNVWKWAGGDNDSFWIAKSTINATHTWINITGIASNVFPSMFYIDRGAMYSAPKTGFEINQHQGIIIKTWDLEQLRGRSNDYYISMWFDTMLESTAPTENLEIWYCNDTFDPLTDDPTLVCDRKDSWTGSRWMDHEAWQPHVNVSYCKPLVISADISTCSCPPTEIDYIYITSETLTSKSYILNATNYDPGITNITYAETETMWLYNELSGVSTPLAYTPSFYMTFVRDYEEYIHHLYIANDQNVWGHSELNNITIGISDIPPTHAIFNYFWWDNTTDYNMNSSYEESFWVNLTYGFDPDNDAALTHVLSLYEDDYNFIAFINSSLIGNQTDDDVFFDIDDYKAANRKFKLKIVSTDNEGSTSSVWSKTFELPADNKFYKTIRILEGFPTVLSNTLSTFLSYLPLFIGILIGGALILLTVGIFGKFKRW